jgi:hypothetical protein
MLFSHVRNRSGQDEGRPAPPQGDPDVQDAAHASDRQRDTALASSMGAALKAEQADRVLKF